MRPIICALLLALTGSVHAIPLTVELHAWDEQCGNNNGRIEAWVNGGQAPYTLDWSNGETNVDFIAGLDIGTYSLTVTDDLGAQVTQQVTIMDVPVIEVPAHFWNSQIMGVGYVWVSNAGLSACPGGCNGGFAWNLTGFNPNVMLPVTFTPAEDTQYPWGGVFTGYCGQQEPVLQITDATGCTGTFPLSPVPEANYLGWTLVNVEPACGNSGSITIDVGTDYAVADVRLLDASYTPIGLPYYNMQGGMPDITWNNLSAGEYHVEQWLSFVANACAPLYMDVSVPSAGNPCGIVTGTMFLDHDQDCAQDANDEPIPYRVLEVLPGPNYTITDGAGHYDLGVGYGNFTIDQQGDGTLFRICPANQQQPFTIDAVDPLVTIDFADSSLVPLDVYTNLSTGPIRPGFVASYHGAAWNASGQLSGSLDASFTFEAPLTFVAADPLPTSVVGNVISWTGLPGLGAFGQSMFHVDLQVPPDVLLIGTTTTAVLTVDQAITESDLANNSTTLVRTITGSYDPNEKVARTSTGFSDEQFFIGTDEWIDYTIRFQNTGNDTAFTVAITDTLAAELDMSTFLQGVASHPFHVSFKMGRVVEWRFENIDLPDSTTNEAASHGLISFRIKPHLPLLPGTEISNTANIFFDFNPPVITEPSVLTAEFSTGVNDRHQTRMHMYPNPANDRVRVNWPQGTPLNSPWSLVAPDGRVVLSGRTKAQDENLDIRSAATGTYVLRLETNTGVNTVTLLRSAHP